MPAGSGDGSLEDHGGSYLEKGKERQPTMSRIPEEKEPEKNSGVPNDVIKRAVDAAIAHLERLTKSFP